MSVLVNGAEGWICPKCGRALSPTITACPYCGEELQTETYNDTEVLEYFGIPTSQEITVKYCDECEYSNKY